MGERFSCLIAGDIVNLKKYTRPIKILTIEP